MKKIFVIFGLVFVCITAFAHTINWHVGDTIIQTTTCESGDSITPPTAPAKYGYSFAGWASYTELEYIESTGTQYIDTGIVPTTNNTYRVKTTAAFTTSTDADQWVVATGGSSQRCQFVGRYNSKFVGGYGDEWTYYSDIFDVNMYYSVDISIENGHQNFDGTLTDYTMTGSFAQSIYMFGTHIGSGITARAFCRLKRTEFYINNQLVHDFIPAKRNSDNVVGMYDTVSQTFFTNAGTGTFIAGPEVGGL